MELLSPRRAPTSKRFSCCNSGLASSSQCKPWNTTSVWKLHASVALHHHPRLCALRTQAGFLREPDRGVQLSLAGARRRQDLPAHVHMVLSLTSSQRVAQSPRLLAIRVPLLSQSCCRVFPLWLKEWPSLSIYFKKICVHLVTWAGGIIQLSFLAVSHHGLESRELWAVRLVLILCSMKKDSQSRL